MTQQPDRKWRKRFFTACSWCTVLLATAWILQTPLHALEYNYPYHDPYLATVTAAILDDGPDPRPKSAIVHIPGLPGRNRLPTLEGRGTLSVLLYRQKQPAPLLFILSGIGANPFFGMATYLARLFYEQGFHVVILPSPMSWNFALSASRSGAPGFAPADARDLYAIMQNSISTLKAQHDVKITEVNFIGLSLGALEGAYLSVIDADERKIGIEKFLLVNPPLDISYALKTLDAWGALQYKLGAEKSKGLIAKAIGIVQSFSDDKRDDPAVVDKFAKQFAGFTTEELQFLIAADLQSLLPELVYVTQLIHDQKVLTAARDNLRKRLRQARDLTFMDYSEKIAVPLWKAQASEPQAVAQDFMKRGSLAPIFDRLRGNSKVYFVHNADDCLSEKQSIEAFKEALGEHVTLYPHGGHLGNLWYPQNRDYVLSLFRKSSTIAQSIGP